MAHRTGFLYVHPILEANKRTEYQAIGSQSVTLIVGDVTLSANLDTFFPFDPYRLKKSQSWIDDIYREWNSVAIFDEEEEEEEEAEGVGEVNGIDVLAVPQLDDFTSNGLGESFEQMSISPDKPGLAGHP